MNWVGLGGVLSFDEDRNHDSKIENEKLYYRDEVETNITPVWKEIAKQEDYKKASHI